MFAIRTNGTRTITFLFGAGPFHQIFEKRPNLVFDGRRGDSLLRLPAVANTEREHGKGRTNNVVARGCDSLSWAKERRPAPPD